MVIGILSHVEVFRGTTFVTASFVKDHGNSGLGYAIEGAMPPLLWHKQQNKSEAKSMAFPNGVAVCVRVQGVGFKTHNSSLLHVM